MPSRVSVESGSHLRIACERCQTRKHRFLEEHNGVFTRATDRRCINAPPHIFVHFPKRTSSCTELAAAHAVSSVNRAVWHRNFSRIHETTVRWELARMCDRAFEGEFILFRAFQQKQEVANVRLRLGTIHTLAGIKIITAYPLKLWEELSDETIDCRSNALSNLGVHIWAALSIRKYLGQIVARSNRVHQSRWRIGFARPVSSPH